MIIIIITEEKQIGKSEDKIRQDKHTQTDTQTGAVKNRNERLQERKKTYSLLLQERKHTHCSIFKSFDRTSHTTERSTSSSSNAIF